LPGKVISVKLDFLGSFFVKLKLFPIKCIFVLENVKTKCQVFNISIFFFWCHSYCFLYFIRGQQWLCT